MQDVPQICDLSVICFDDGRPTLLPLPLFQVVLAPGTPLLSPQQCEALVNYTDELYSRHMASHPDGSLIFDGGYTHAPKDFKVRA